MENNDKATGKHNVGVIGATIISILGRQYLDMSTFHVDNKVESSKPKLPCLNCGKLKQHNNAYCSAECCKEHRKKK